MSDSWTVLKEWPGLILEQLDDAGVARITLNRPEKRNCWNEDMHLGFFESLDIIRADKEIKAVITRGAGKAFSSGLDLAYLRASNQGPVRDFDQPGLTIQLGEAIRWFPRIMIAQVHGYVLGGAFAVMNCHDLVFGANDVEIGMPEIMRGSFGQFITATLLHSGVPIKKHAWLQLTGNNVTGEEADRLGIISKAVPADELETFTIQIARELSTRHLAPLEHAKITVQMGRDLTYSQAIQLDGLVSQRMRRTMDPLDDVENYLASQKGGPNVHYKRGDV
jgi:enoyl-CoA hydratase/carnithine racemase